MSVSVAEHDPESIITEAQAEYSTAQGDVESSCCSKADVSFPEKLILISCTNPESGV